VTDRVAVTMAAVYAVPALLWGVVAYNHALAVRELLPRARFFALFPVWSALAAFVNAVLAVGWLAAVQPGGPVHRTIVLLVTLGSIAFAAVFRHIVVVATTLLADDRRSGTRWLVVNYGAALVVAGGALVPLFLRADLWDASAAAGGAYVVLMAALAVWEGRARIEHGRLRPGTLTTRLHRVDVGVLAAGGLVLCAAIVIGLGEAVHDRAADLAIAAVGTVAAIAPALRNVTAVVRGVIMTAAMLAAAGAVCAGARALGASVTTPGAHRFVDLAAVGGLVLVLVPGRARLGVALDRLLLRHGRRVGEELRAFLRTLSPELGVQECCRRALAEARRAWRLHGAAIVLVDGTALVEGSLAVEPVLRAWPTGGDPLPAHAFSWLWVNDLRLRTALADADVAGVIPITSPRRRWGYLLTSIGLIGWDRSREQIETGKMFCDQLALVLDGAELLERAVAVERSLAHAEKLAAIGETAARIAHDIRNPVTAARSLAQQLAHAPGSPFRAEHEVILAELERIERRVASLLRFARRDELAFAPVELAALVRDTVEALRGRLEATGIAVEVDVPGGAAVTADREKVRETLVNLIENAADALAEGATGRPRLVVSVATSNGTATIRVTDNGPGVPDDVLARIFEPFFSGKPSGTGLGLAIAKQTVDGHGGRIGARRPPAGGLELRIDLPLTP
jgi:signal transduction histidine kinase